MAVTFSPFPSSRRLYSRSRNGLRVRTNCRNENTPNIRRRRGVGLAILKLANYRSKIDVGCGLWVVDDGLRILVRVQVWSNVLPLSARGMSCQHASQYLQYAYR